MINKYYRFLGEENNTLYYFQSEGNKGKVIKVVQFALDNDNFWNLGFGDLQNGEVNDMVLTNNHDAAKVLGTVARIIYSFFEQYPNETVVIKPVDEKRKRLYNLIFQRHFKEINEDFEIIGVVGYIVESYSISQNYDFFIVKLKSK
jgi:hypothetical protein